MNLQAERCDRYEVKKHIYRQRTYGARLIGDHDRPRPIELAATLAMVVCVSLYFAAKHYHWFGWGL